MKIWRDFVCFTCTKIVSITLCTAEINKSDIVNAVFNSALDQLRDGYCHVLNNYS